MPFQSTSDSLSQTYSLNHYLENNFFKKIVYVSNLQHFFYILYARTLQSQPCSLSLSSEKSEIEDEKYLEI